MEKAEQRKTTSLKRTSNTFNSMAGNGLEYGKIPPQALDLEEAVLGAVMLEGFAINKVIDILTPEMFYKQSHQFIYSAVKTLFANSEPIDILTVTNQLSKDGHLEVVGGSYYVVMLTNKVASSANIEFHARIIQQKFIQRELIRISSDIITDAFDERTDVLELLDIAERNLFKIAEDNLRRSASKMKDVLKDALHSIEEATKHSGHISGIPSGFHKIDNLTSGWQRSDLIILAARPGMGKTAFVLSLARNMAVDHSVPVAVFSLEMSAVQLVTRLISAEAEVNAEKLKKGTLDQSDWSHLNRSIQSLEKAKIFIDDTPALSIFELRAKCRRLKSSDNIGVIIIDYLQLMTAGSDKGGNREQEISTISRSLKALAKELNVPIITLSQLNRSVETRTGLKRPQLSDLRESGAIEQDADMVCFLYRPEYYGFKQNEQGQIFADGYAEFIVAKHRNGALENIPIKFLNTFAKFTNLTEYFSDDDNSGGGLAPNNSFDVNKVMPSKMNIDDDMDTSLMDMPPISRSKTEDHNPF